MTEENISMETKEEQQDLKPIRLAPSKARIFAMDNDILLSHWQLIKMKKSSLSATQRQLVENRVEFLLKRNRFLKSDLDNLLK